MGRERGLGPTLWKDLETPKAPQGPLPPFPPGAHVTPAQLHLLSGADRPEAERGGLLLVVPSCEEDVGAGVCSEGLGSARGSFTLALPS